MRSIKATQATPPDVKAPETTAQLPAGTQKEKKKKKLKLGKERVTQLISAAGTEVEAKRPSLRTACSPLGGNEDA